MVSTSVKLTSPRKAIASGIAYLPEGRAANALFPMMTVAQNVTLPRLSKFIGLGGLINNPMESAAVSALLKRLDLRSLKGAKIRTFSGGNQQKAIIARWLLGSADMFLFDEPTQGIDVGAREQVYKVIRELAEKGAGIIVVSSDAEELARLCSTIYVMIDGTVEHRLTGNDITESKISQVTVEGGTKTAKTGGRTSAVAAADFSP